MMSQAMQRTMPASTSAKSAPGVAIRVYRQRSSPRLQGTPKSVRCSSYRQNYNPWFGRGPFGFNPMMGNITPEQLESMIQQFAKQFGPQPQYNCGQASAQGFTLPVDLEEQATEYLLIADVPGLQKSDLKISINQTDKTVKITGERQRATGQDSDNQQPRFRTQFERGMGKFQRTLTGLPQDADLSAVSARVEKGVLTIHIQKKDLRRDEDEISINID